MLEVKDLSIIIDTKLNFNKHIDIVIRKTRKVLGCIRICKDFEQIVTLAHLHIKLVSPY